MSLDRGLTVILTGSTGNLGAYLLDLLIVQPRIQRIYCLNRSADAQSRQAEAHAVRGLVVDWETKDVEFIQVDFAAANLDLPDAKLDELLGADLFIHNAWPVDFNRHFSSFEPSIMGVQHLINFCQRTSMPFLFVSSVGATSNWGSHAPTARARVPEVELTDWKLSRTGYGQSKLVSERLLAHHARTHNLPVAVVRVGQLSGPVLRDIAGQWTEREWIPSLIRSSAALQALPASLGPAEIVDWVPVDLAARAILELGLYVIAEAPREASFFHVVNPQRVGWGSLVPAMLRHLPKSTRTIPFIDWVEELKRSATKAESGVDSGENPAVKLLDFFDHLQDRNIRFPKATVAELEVKRTLKVCPTLAQLEAVGPEWMELWMRQWNWTGEIDAANGVES